MKNNFYLLIFTVIASSCNGVIKMNSESSSHEEKSVSIKSETIRNGDTTMSNYDKKEKSHSEKENKTRIGFDVEDKTGIADEVRRKLKKDRQDSTDLEEETPYKKTPKEKSSTSNLKATINCEAGISADDFINLKEKVASGNMDTDKLKRAKSLFNERCVTSKQAQQLVGALRMENNKLELAKFLYGRTLDKDKFVRVAEEFSFEDTKEEIVKLFGRLKSWA